MTFINHYLKEEFVTAARAVKLSACDIGFEGSSQKVFVNDHLTPEAKILLTKVKGIAKDRNYKFVWVKYCKIHVRKDETSRVLIIANDRDLNKIV